jgi:flagellar FliL protein
MQGKLMAEPKSATKDKEKSTPQEKAAPSAPARPRGSLTAKLLVLAFVLAVIVTECLAAYLLIPSVSANEGMGGATTQTPPRGKQPPKEEKKEKDTPTDQVEVDLGEFTVTAFQPTSNSTLRLALHLFGTVAAGDAPEFAARIKDAQHRFRESVIVTLRGAEVSDLTDAGLGLLKRTILEKTNAILGKPLLKMVIFSDFSFVEM